MKWSQELEHARSGPVLHLPYGGVDGREMPFPHHSLPIESGKAGHEVVKAGELSCPSPAAALGRVSLVPCLGNTGELALMA